VRCRRSLRNGPRTCDCPFKSVGGVSTTSWSSRPGSGGARYRLRHSATRKSTFARQRYEATHVVVSKDRMRNNRRPARRQARLVADALGAGQSVVIDNTKEGQSVERATRALLGKRDSFKHEMLFKRGINFNDLPEWQRRGTGV
jgi:hypothetical protein